MLVVLSRIPSFEGDHHAPQEAVELLLLPSRQRLGKERLFRALDPQALLMLLPALRRQLDEHASAVVRIAQAADEAFLLERVEPARHCAARQVRAARKLAGLAAGGGARPAPPGANGARGPCWDRL